MLSRARGYDKPRHAPLIDNDRSGAFSLQREGPQTGATSISAVGAEQSWRMTGVGGKENGRIESLAMESGHRPLDSLRHLEIDLPMVGVR